MIFTKSAESTITHSSHEYIYRAKDWIQKPKSKQLMESEGESTISIFQNQTNINVPKVGFCFIVLTL